MFRLCSHMFLKSSLQNQRGMRTKRQQVMEVTMLTEIKDILSRSRATLIEDTIGVVSLFTLLFACLHLFGTA